MCFFFNLQVSWFSSVIFLGVLTGCLASLVPIERLGRKATLLLSAVPTTLGWVLVVAGTDFSVLLMGRFLTGVGAGSYRCSVAAYLAETGSKEVRL